MDGSSSFAVPSVLRNCDNVREAGALANGQATKKCRGQAERPSKFDLDSAGEDMRQDFFGKFSALIAGLLFTFTAYSGTAIAEEKLHIGWRFDQELFPSFIIANSTRKSPAKTPSNFFGDSYGSVGVGVLSPHDGAKARIEVSIDQISDPTSFLVTLPRGGKKYFLSPKIRYKYAELSRIRQPISVNVTFALFMDGNKVGEETHTIRVRSINDVPYEKIAKNGKHIDYSYLFAAYVNENHPWIDQVLRRALEVPVPIVREFVGYQRGPQEVVNQVFAVWYYFQRSGFTYSSITTPTGFTEGVHSQYVRTLEDSLRTRQSNCIDGTVLFASILRRIGIDPFIVLIPGHAFLGFYLDPSHQTTAYLETTAMNSEMNPYHTRRPSQFRDSLARTFQLDTKLGPAAQSFNYALAAGQDNYAKAQAGLQSKALGYRLIDIDKWRKAELNPINR